MLIQKLMEHHALCVIVKENIIADMFIFFFHFTDSASPQMLRFLYEAVQHLYRCNLFPERVPEYFFAFNASETASFSVSYRQREHQTAVDDAVHLIFVDHTENIVDTSVFGVKHAQFVFI